MAGKAGHGHWTWTRMRRVDTDKNMCVAMNITMIGVTEPYSTGTFLVCYITGLRVSLTNHSQKCAGMQGVK